MRFNPDQEPSRQMRNQYEPGDSSRRKSNGGNEVFALASQQALANAINQGDCGAVAATISFMVTDGRIPIKEAVNLAGRAAKLSPDHRVYP